MADMEVAPRLLREVEFPEKLRGYHPDHVDEFLEQVAVGIEQLQERLRQATERANKAEARLAEQSNDDDVLRRTLVLAQRTADTAIAEAQESASKIVSEAEQKARGVLSEAEEQARAKVAEADRTLREEVNRLTAARSEMAADLSLLRQQLENERRRAYEVHSEALRWLEDHIPVSAGGASSRRAAERDDERQERPERPERSERAEPQSSPDRSLISDDEKTAESRTVSRGPERSLNGSFDRTFDTLPRDPGTARSPFNGPSGDSAGLAQTSTPPRAT